jgi:hypothetical protein
MIEDRQRWIFMSPSMLTLCIAIGISAESNKPTLSSPLKRRASSPFEDDAENIDPSAFESPLKRVKAFDGTPKKASRFILTASQSSTKQSSSSGLLSSVPVPSPKLVIPASPASTPISARGGSPKHKRVGLLSKRRAQSSPFTRVDPPFFSRSNASSLPFSLDAALSGTIPSYTPKPSVDISTSTFEDSMPKTWFFDIHEDTAEQEATNLMEHSACTLDISSDDDSETKLRNEAKERGKENIPPPDYVPNSAMTNSARTASASGADKEDNSAAATTVSSKLRRKMDIDAMAEDRSPLSDLPPVDYYTPEDDNADPSENEKHIPSPLSEVHKDFDFEMQIPKREAPSELPDATVVVWEDNQASSNSTVEDTAQTNENAHAEIASA